MNLGMFFEVLRLQSFKDARPANDVQVSVILLAKEGFYFDQNSGRILCFSCGCEYRRQFSSELYEIVHDSTCQRQNLNKSIRSWTSGLSEHDVRRQDHVTPNHQNNEQVFPNAELPQENSPSNNGTIQASVNGHSNNILLHDEQLQDLSNTQEPHNSAGRTQAPTHITSASSAETTPKTSGSSQAKTVSERGNISEHSTLNISSVSNPHFSTRQARIATFTSWNPAHSHRLDDLADAGFFYTGNVDCVRCFCCGLGLKFWRPTDDIAYQHARLRPTCAFNRLCNGQAFIDGVQRDIQAQQGPSNLDNLHISETSTRSSGSTSPGASLPHANEIPSNNAVTTTIQTSPAVTTNIQTSPAVTTNTQTSQAVITNGLASPAVTANGLASPSATRHGRTPSLGSSNSTYSIDSSSSEDSGIATASYANADSTLQATHDNLTDLHEATLGIDHHQTATPVTLTDELRVVEREHSLLAERTICRVCHAAPVSCIFLPCGHVATCQDCADKASRCVLCNKVIIGTANVYLA